MLPVFISYFSSFLQISALILCNLTRRYINCILILATGIRHGWISRIKSILFYRKLRHLPPVYSKKTSDAPSRGRLDYQLLYVASGKAHFYFSGEEKIISAGNMVLYRPKEEQRYYYYAAEQPEIYWVHFTGNNVKNILRKYGITDDTRVIYSGVSMEYKRLYLSMIQELQMKREDYEELLVHYFMQLLISIHRQILVKPRKKNLMLMDEMDRAVDYFREHYNEAISIEAYAADHNISVGWFYSRTSSSIRRQHRRSISSLCASRMQNCFWKLRIIMYPRFQISSAMKIRCISAGSSKSNAVCRRFSSENSFFLRMRKTAIQL